MTNFLVAFAGVYTVALKLGQPLDLHLFLLAGGTSLGAAGGWHAIVKPFLDWRERRKSPVAARRAKAIKAIEDLPDTASVADEQAAVQAALGFAP